MGRDATGGRTALLEGHSPRAILGHVLLGPALASLLCLGMLLVLPGAGVVLLLHVARERQWQWVAPPEGSERVRLARWVALSLVLVEVIGYVMVASGTFTATWLALAVTPFAVAGLPTVAHTLVALVRRRPGVTLSLLVLSFPFLSPALHSGHAPVNNFNWYYWGLGRDLTSAGGVPHWISEYGAHVRWQPDYLSFNILTEGFRGLFVGASGLTSLSMWIVPISVFAVFVTYAALRLWFTGPVAVAGTGLLLVTTAYTGKLGNGRPEIVGFALGLVAVIVGIDALRRRSTSGYLLAAGVLGIDTSVHAIGALMAGVVLVTASLCVLVRARDRVLHRLRIPASGAALFALVVALTGWALQGRVFVGTNASNPRLVDGGDPTLSYFTLTEGLDHRPDRGTRLVGQLLSVVQNIPVGVGLGTMIAVLLTALAVAALVWGTAGSREAAVVGLALAAFIAVGAAWFGLHFQTFVPANTGLSRFTQWAPVASALIVVAGLDAILRRIPWRRSSAAGSAAGWARALPGAAVVGIGIVGAVLWALVVSTQFPLRAPLSPGAEAAVHELDKVAAPGDVLLTNLVTHGILEYLTPAEVPVEGRQPVIESSDVLEHTNRYLQDVITFFDHPAEGDLSPFRARWILTSTNPQEFGALRTFGEHPERLGLRPGVHRVWGDATTALYQVDGGAATLRSVGPAENKLLRLLVASALLAGGVVLLLRLSTTRPPRTVRTPVAAPVRPPVQTVGAARGEPALGRHRR